MGGWKLFQVIKKTSLITLLFTSFFFVGIAHALSVEEVVEKVVNDSPELKIILEKRIQAVDDYKGNRASYLPSIYVDFVRKYEKTDPLNDATLSNWTGSNKFQIILEQKIFDLEALANIAKSSFLVQSQEFENQKMLESLIQLAVVAYYDVVQAQYVLSVNQQYYNDINAVSRLIYKMRSQGTATLGDLNLVQARLASANTTKITAAANLDKIKSRLAYLLNLVAQNNTTMDPPSAMLPDLTSKDFYDLADKMIAFLPVSANELEKSALRSNVDILLVRSNLCAAGYQLESTKSKYLPTISAMVTLKDEEQKSTASIDRTGKLELEAKYYLYDGGQRHASVDAAESAIRELEYNYDVKVRDIRDKAYSAFNQLRSLEKQRASILKEIEAAENIDRIYRQQFKFASRSLNDRLDNLDKLVQGRLKLINLDYDILQARITVLQLEGKFVEFFGFQNYLDYSKLHLC